MSSDTTEQNNSADQYNSGHPDRSRRTFLRYGTGALGGLAANSLLSSPAAAADGGRKPNIVFLLGEGHRLDAQSLTGNKIVHTPNLDRIGREGVQFQNSFCVNALCSPSRGTCLTGLYSHTTGAIDNQRRMIPKEVPLISDLLRKAGYEVAMCGKAHMKNGFRERYWDYYFAYAGAATDYYWPVVAEGRHGKVNPQQTYEGYVDEVVTDRALKWVRQKRDKPFCLFLWFQAPHAPFFRPRRYMDLYNGVAIPKPATFDDDLKGYPGKPRAFADATNKIGPYGPQRGMSGASNCARSLEEVVKDYYAGVKDVDDNVGKLFDTLTDLGCLDDTAILWSSDHGFFLGEWRMYDKRLMHEPSIRVPLFVRYPRLIKTAASYQQMALNLDFAPTILDLAGVKIPEWVQGRSLVPFFEGTPPASWRKDWLYEYYEYPGPHEVRKNRGVRTDRYKYIHYWEVPEEFELYDLQEDPGELHNLYGDKRYAELTAHLRNRLEKLRRETGDTFEET